MGEDFSGSRAVTSRNPLIQIGATNGTKSERFDVKGVPSCCSRVLGDAPEGPFATVNFAEFIFRDCMKRPQPRVNRLSMRGLIAAYTNASPLAQSFS